VIDISLEVVLKIILI